MKTVGFCAVAGSGMSALAQVLKAKGFEVYGSDRSFDQGKEVAIRQALSAAGIKICPQDGSMFANDNIEVLYTSTAVENTIPDVKRAMELGIPVKRRSDLLAEVFSSYAKRVAVGGTSGKSTLTAMIGYILDKSNLHPTVINGAGMQNYASSAGLPNVILNEGDICIIEADESDGSIEKYTPYIAVVNNISLDHKTLNELEILFGNFVARASFGAVLNQDCPHCRKLSGRHPNIKTFSIEDATADFYAADIKAEYGGSSFVFNSHTYRLPLIGRFNVANAMAALAVCSLLGVDPDSACEILQTFAGAKRRLEVLGQKNGITVIDDFAHNPDKVAASMSALKSYNGRLLIMFQPHGFAPMRLMGREIMESFARYMDADDILMMPEIYFSGGTVNRDISSQYLTNYLQSLGKQALFFNHRDDLERKLLQLATKGDRIVLMGARDNTITDMGYRILENCR
ncbi:MAG: UDP-N-acetylmuramate--alanine ligase [Alphaproteobacteria bacterium]|nr:UDP-N-acetylmuramate--alanine ligase [Alphaproteobacteria bacterium]MBQ9234975.1 UDP-N-acetylmuramate--alanine ligase [Alphaproteobacteria bacterium]